jgi:F-type H+-transporting ATPase subunit b
LAAAREQADDIVARARKAGETVEAESVADARRKREELMEQTRREIESETRRAIQQIRAEVADLTVLATEKVTRKTLTGDDQRKLVEEAVSELDFAALAGERSGGE